MNTSLILLLSWAVIGIIELCLPGKISKFSYGLTWFALMIKLLQDVLNKMNI